MNTVNLYKYVETNGIVVTPHARNEADTPDSYRLIADEGKILKNGENLTYCVDTRTIDGWEEIDDPTPPEKEMGYLDIPKEETDAAMLREETEE